MRDRKKKFVVKSFVRTGYRVNGDIQKQAELLADLGRSGGMTVRTVVDMAKDKKCPFHPNFTWNLKHAAQKRWEDEARYLMRAIGYQIINVRTKEVISESRTTVSLVYDNTVEQPHTSPRVLVGTEATLKDPERRYSILNLAIAELEAFVEKYATLSEMAGVIREARKVFGKLAKRL